MFAGVVGVRYLARQMKDGEQWPYFLAALQRRAAT